MDDFASRPLGAFTGLSFGASAVLFALEHGSFWDVGLAAGLVYNLWMAKTRSLGDLIACHAVTNTCLAGWVLATGQWQYW
jgi:CAAX prenyl protease-like protein